MRASGYGPVRVLVPMVSSREEIVAVRRLLKRVAGRSCAREGHEVADMIPLGAMIEVPAAAIALPGFVGAVDFLSIGTNDLVQYLLAADRNNEALGELYTPLHPARDAPAARRSSASPTSAGSRSPCAARWPATRRSRRCCWRWA